MSIEHGEHKEVVDEQKYLTEVDSLQGKLYAIESPALLQRAMTIQQKYANEMQDRYEESEFSYMFCKAYHKYMGSTMKEGYGHKEFLDFPGEDSVMKFAPELDAAVKAMVDHGDDTALSALEKKYTPEESV